MLKVIFEKCRPLLRDFWNVLVLFTVLVALAAVFWGRQGSAVSDGGREIFFPVAMLQGKVLYKDLFNLYGPLAYQLNSLLFYAFSVRMESLYMAGLAATFVMVSGCYAISRLWLSPILSLLIGLQIIFLFGFSPILTALPLRLCHAVWLCLCRDWLCRTAVLA